MALRAEIILILRPRADDSRNVWTITRIRPRLSRPIVTHRSSASPCSSSGSEIAAGSRKSPAACSKLTPCLRRFVFAFAGSHSKLYCTIFSRAIYPPAPSAAAHRRSSLFSLVCQLRSSKCRGNQALESPSATAAPVILGSNRFGAREIQSDGDGFGGFIDMRLRARLPDVLEEILFPDVL